MLSILGVGAAFPETVITSEILSGLCPSEGPVTPETSGGIISRRSTLPLSYLLDSKNQEPEEGLKAATVSPTDLAARAVEQALAMAGISKDQVGLMIGDSTTATQSTPSESQRVGEKLQVKVDAYDVLGGGAAGVLQLDVINRWRGEKTPEYVILLTSNTPTQRTDYRRLNEARYVGDGASAFVVSKQHQGRYPVLWSRYRTAPSNVDLFTFDRYQHCRLAENALPAFEAALCQELAEAKRHVAGGGDVYCVLSGLCPESEQRVARFGGVSSERLLSLTATHGHSIGSQVGATVAELGSKIPKGSSIILVSVSAGSGIGSAVLHVQS